MCVVPRSVSGYITSKSIELGFGNSPGTSRYEEMVEFATAADERVPSIMRIEINIDDLAPNQITTPCGLFLIHRNLFSMV